MIDNIMPNINNCNQSRYWQNSSANFTQTITPKNTLSNKQKSVIFASSVLGIVPILAFLAHQKGFSLKPSKIFSTKIKDWALFKYKPIGKALEFKAPQILSVAAGSIAGGFIGGAIVDKDNIKAKKREVMNQMLGDIIIPLGCVFAGAEAFSKYENKLVNLMPQMSKTTKFAKVVNTVSKSIPSAIATIVPLGIGIILGNKVSNYINEKLYHKEVDRNIRVTDFAPHLDDLCMAVSMVNKTSTFASGLARVIPLALVVPGYEVGRAQD